MEGAGWKGVLQSVGATLAEAGAQSQWQLSDSCIHNCSRHACPFLSQISSWSSCALCFSIWLTCPFFILWRFNRSMYPHLFQMFWLLPIRQQQKEGECRHKHLLTHILTQLWGQVQNQNWWNRSTCSLGISLASSPLELLVFLSFPTTAIPLVFKPQFLLNNFVYWSSSPCLCQSFSFVRISSSFFNQEIMCVYGLVM